MMTSRKRYLPLLAAALTFLLVGCAASTMTHRSQSSTILPDASEALVPPDAFLDREPTALSCVSSGEEPDGDGAGVENGDGRAPNDTADAANTESASTVEENPLDAALDLISTSQDYWSSGETEKAIDSLDNAYALILSAPDDESGKDNQQKDDLRFMVSKRLLEIYSSRLSAINGMYKEIPLEMNEHVEREIKSFQTVERDYFLAAYKRSGRYRDEMVKAFREAGIPEEITWLPLIESGFKVRAFSRARALGLWQFIPSTGYKFGLKRTTWIDERLDPEKSTQAAINYLKELHLLFGDWATVLAAYNCGEGNVLRVIRQQKVKYLDNFWDLYERLPRETARYYPRFLAVLAIIKDPAKYGFTLDELERPVPYEIITTDRSLQLGTVAQSVGCSFDVLRSLNAELRQGVTPKRAYDLKVPYGMKDAVLAKLDTVPTWNPPRAKYVYHRVRRGETLSQIAAKYHTSSSTIMKMNRIRNVRQLRIGRKLKIPQGGIS